MGLSFASQDIVNDNSGLRALQVADFAAVAAQEKVPVVIGGDTNLPALSYTLHHSLSAYHDAFTEAGWGFGYTHPVGGRHAPWMRIDRIMGERRGSLHPLRGRLRARVGPRVRGRRPAACALIRGVGIDLQRAHRRPGAEHAAAIWRAS